MWQGHESVRALRDTLSNRYIFPPERLKRAVAQYEAAQAHQADWPVSLRLASQRTQVELAVIDWRNPLVGPHQIDLLLESLSRWATAYSQASPNLDRPALRPLSGPHTQLSLQPSGVVRVPREDVA